MGGCCARYWRPRDDRTAERCAHLVGVRRDGFENGFDGLAALVQTKLSEHAYSGQAFAFRGRRGDQATFSIPILFCNN